MKDKILLALNDTNESNYIDKIINSFPYEERIKFYNEMFSSKDEKIYNSLKYVLTFDELKGILKNKYGNKTLGSLVDPDERRYFISIFNCLNPEDKIEEFIKLDETLIVYSFNFIFHTDELKSSFIDKMIAYPSRLTYFRETIFHAILKIENLDVKLKNIDKLLQFGANENKLEELIPILNTDEFSHAFDELDLSDTLKAYLITKCTDSKKAKDYFLKLNDEHLKEIAFKRFSNNYINTVNESNISNNELDNNFSLEDKESLIFSIKNINVKKLFKDFSDEEKLEFLRFFDEEDKIKLLSSMTISRIMFRGLSYLEEDNSVIEVLCHYRGTPPNYQKNLDEVIKRFATIFEVNFEHLVELSKIVSLEIIYHLYEENIKDILNMNDEDFKKFISFFNANNIKLTSYTLNNIFEAFANKAFNLKYDYIRHYFTDVMAYCEKKDAFSAEEIIYKVYRGIGSDIIKEHTGYEIYKLLASKDKKAIDEFHDACNEYISKLRNEEVETTKNMYKNDYLNIEYEVSSALKAIISYGTAEWIYENYLSKMMECFSPREKELLENKDLFKQIYDFKENPTSSPPQIIKTNMFTFNQIMDKFYAEYKYDTAINNILKESSAKLVPVIPDIDVRFLINVMSHLKVKELKEKLLNNNMLCSGLNNLLRKYSYLSFHEYFSEIQLEADSYCDATTVASIFLNYDNIIKDLKKAKTPPSMISILDAADAYNPESKIYSYIFESDNFKIITLNSPENRATTLRNERREDSLRNYIRCFKREKVAVPSFDEDISVNNKKINVVVGNFTNPINLTYGERTGSCMRSGGLGEELYDFCLNDDHGFHIRFTDPNTGEFISRVSGFRNGNTVFLNQLRESNLEGYDSNDLIEICKKVADELIERSKDSKNPINNVVISHDKVMDNDDIDTINIEAPNIYEGLDKMFYFDLVPNRSVILSTSNPDNSLVPVVLGPDHTDYYDVQRDKIKFATNPSEAVKHIEVIEQLFSGKKLADITVTDKEYELCYYGEDWYVAVDKEGNIEKKIMSKSKDHEKAFSEMSIVLEDLYQVEKIFGKEENKLSQK